MDGIQMAYLAIAILGAALGLTLGLILQAGTKATTTCAMICAFLLVGFVWTSVNFPIFG